MVPTKVVKSMANTILKYVTAEDGIKMLEELENTGRLAGKMTKCFSEVKDTMKSMSK